MAEVGKIISFRKKLLFKVFLTITSIIILLIIEGILRLTGYGDNLNLFIKNLKGPLTQYKLVNPIIGKKYFQKLEYDPPPNDVFLTKKPENCFRIFVKVNFKHAIS